MDSLNEGRSRLRRMLARSAFALALALVGWLALGIFDFLPFVIELPGESRVRVHAAMAVGCLIAAAWGFWDE